MHEAMSPDNAYLRFFSASLLAAGRESTRICREPEPGHATLLALSSGDEVGLVAFQGDLDRQVGEVGEELVQRRVDRANRHRQAVHRRQDFHEVAGLKRLQGGQRTPAVLVGLGQDEVLDQLAALTEEHVLSADQADPLGTEPAGPGGVGAGVRVGQHAQPAPAVGVRHNLVHRPDEISGVAGARGKLALEVAHDRGRHDGDLPEVDVTAGAVDGDHVALGDGNAARRGELPGLGVHVKRLGTADAGLAHAPGDHGRVAGLAATAGHDAPGPPAAPRSGRPPPRSACRPGSAASTACHARW